MGMLIKGEMSGPFFIKRITIHVTQAHFTKLSPNWAYVHVNLTLIE